MPYKNDDGQPVTSNFIHLVVNAGNEDLAKKEMEVFYPHFKPSFSRKGFLTYKSDNPIKLHQLPKLYFSRRTVLGFEKGQQEQLLSKYGQNDMPIQIFARDEIEFAPKGPTIAVGQQYIQLINTQEDEFWVGIGILKPWEVPTPGGILKSELPAQSPSRTYLKAQAAVEYFKIPVRAKQNVLELGSSPGGTSYYLLNLGLNVWGVDPGEMAQQCLQYENFHHLRLCSQELSYPTIPISVDWLFCDMNLAPFVSLKQTGRLAKMCLPRGLKGVIFTVKVPDTKFVTRLPEFIEAAKELLPWPIKTCQFDCHRNEFALVSLPK